MNDFDACGPTIDRANAQGMQYVLYISAELEFYQRECIDLIAELEVRNKKIERLGAKVQWLRNQRNILMGMLAHKSFLSSRFTRAIARMAPFNR